MYAQILKRTMQVNLIGGSEVGLPMDHPATFCIDMEKHAQKKEVEVGMIYDKGTDNFTMAPLVIKKPNVEEDEATEGPNFCVKDLIIMEAQADLYEQQSIIQEGQLTIMEGLAYISEMIEGGE